LAVLVAGALAVLRSVRNVRAAAKPEPSPASKAVARVAMAETLLNR
jgi:hypothetical protein